MNGVGPRLKVALAAAVVLIGFVLLGFIAWFVLRDGDAGTDERRLTQNDGGGAILRLAAPTERATLVRPDDFCLPSSPAIAGATVVECSLTPLLSEVSSRCDATGDTRSTDRLCAPADPAFSELLLGWVVTSRGPGKRTLAVYVGTASPGDGAAPGTGSTATLERRYVAVDDADTWSELAVCPGDIDGNGSVDLAVLARSSAPDRAARPEVVVVSIGTAQAGSRSVKPLQSVTVEGDVPREAGAGCASPLVRALRWSGDGLKVDEAVLAGEPLAGRPQ